MTSAAKRLLVVEDDTSLARVLRDNLLFEDFQVELASDGDEALRAAKVFRPDLIVLDIMLPRLDGFEVCRVLGNGPDRTPIIMLTARTQREDKVRGLELGADDYVTKPFAFDELLARINAVLRRSNPRLDRLVLGDIIVDFRRYRACRHNRDLSLTHREMELLHYLAERASRVVTREELLRLVWRYSEVPVTRTVDNFIARLRRKIEHDPHHPQFIRTVHGDGYSLTIPA
jgi:DNA-binding response OmpR family regulator